MNRLRIAAVALPAIFWILSAPLARAAPDSSDLEVAAPAISFSARSLTVEVRQHGALAGRRLSVIAFVDRNRIGSYPTSGDRTKLVIDELELTPGSHEIRIKSGTFDARDRFRYLSPVVPASVAALLVLIAVAVALRRRRNA